jgi:hypothetical protein
MLDMNMYRTEAELDLRLTEFDDQPYSQDAPALAGCTTCTVAAGVVLAGAFAGGFALGYAQGMGWVSVSINLGPVSFGPGPAVGGHCDAIGIPSV